MMATKKGISCKKSGSKNRINALKSSKKVEASISKTELTKESMMDQLFDIIYEKGNRANPKIAKDIFGVLNKFVRQENRGADAYLKYLDTILKKMDRKENELLFKKSFGTSDAKEIFSGFVDKDAEIQKFKKLKESYYNNKKEKKLENALYDIIKRLYNKKLVFHGEKTSKGGLNRKSDIDGQASELLLKLCGFFDNKNGEKQKYSKYFVGNGDGIQNGLNLDTNKTATGIKVVKSKTGSLFNSAATLDEHSDGSALSELYKRPTSTTHMVFDILKRLGQVPSKYKGQMQRFVDFVDIIDSNYYVVAGVDFENSHRTIAGLSRNLPIYYIYNYFKNPKNTGFELLSDEYINNPKNKVKISKSSSKFLRKIVDYKNKRNQKALDQYREVEHKNYLLQLNGSKSSFILDIGAKITDCPQVAAYHERGSFRLFPNGDVYIYSIEKLPKQIGKYKTEGGHFLIKNMSKKELISFVKKYFQFSPMLGDLDINRILDDIALVYKNKELGDSKSVDKTSKKGNKSFNNLQKIEKNWYNNRVSYTNKSGRIVKGRIIKQTPAGETPADGYVMIQMDDKTIFGIKRATLLSRKNLQIDILDNKSKDSTRHKKKKHIKKYKAVL